MIGMTHGFLRVAAATSECTVADSGANVESIISLIHEAAAKGASLAVFPELAVTGYTCGDLFAQDLLCREAVAAIRSVAERTRGLPVTSVVGFPFAYGNKRYNCAAVVSGGSVVGVVPKTHIPNYGEFYELRHFVPGPQDAIMIPAGILADDPVPFGTRILFSDARNPEIAFAAEICEDLWVPAPPSSSHAAAGALVVTNLSASNELVGKAAYRRTLVSGQSGRGVCAYVYADAGHGESTTDMVFSGHNLIAENGAILAESTLFSTGLICADIDTGRLLQERRRMNTFPAGDGAGSGGPGDAGDGGRGYTRVAVDLDRDRANGAPDLIRHIDPLPFVPSGTGDLAHRCEEVFAIQAAGLARRLAHTRSKSAVIGLSGGLDSTLALLVTIRAFDRLGLDRSGILAVTMPGFGTTKRTRGNALRLASALGTSTEEIRIHKAVRQHFADIGHNPETLDITYENSQARERTQILMDKANMLNGLVIGTGDLSELALGWATYNGDHMSMYAVNVAIPKTLVRHLVRYCADRPGSFVAPGEAKDFSRILVSILETPVSPELLPPENGEIAQKTEHIVGPYELHDFFLYYATRWGFGPAKILFLAEHAFGAEQAFGPGEECGRGAPASGKALVGTYPREEILKWMKVFFRRFFAQQFKRSCLPDGPKVGSVTLSPRSDWRMPSDSSSALWMKELESLG